MRPQVTSTRLGPNVQEETVQMTAPWISLAPESGLVYAECADLHRGSGHVLMLMATSFAPAEKDPTGLGTQKALPAAYMRLLTSSGTLEATEWL